MAVRTLYGEARGEPDDGQRAVAHVLWNRVRDGRWGETLATVCLARMQFSCWNASDPNREQIAALADHAPILERLRSVLNTARNERDPTGGATHYFSTFIGPSTEVVHWRDVLRDIRTPSLLQGRKVITQLMTGWRSVAVSALVSAGVAGSAAWEVRGWRDASLVATAKTAQARAEKAVSDIRGAVANNMADLERQRADEQVKALNAAKDQSRRILELQTRLAESQRVRVKISTQLEEGLNHAPLGDARDLGPAVLGYLERVRSEQSKR